MDSVSESYISSEKSLLGLSSNTKDSVASVALSVAFFCLEVKYEFIVKSPSYWLIVIGKNISGGVIGSGDVVGVDKIVIEFPSIETIVTGRMIRMMFQVK